MIYVDMDGVLADFDGGYQKAFGEPPSGQDHPDQKQTWRNINTEPGFFENLPLTPYGRSLWEIVEPTGAHILTAVAKKVHDCIHQKIAWCRRELQIQPHRVLAVWDRQNKAAYCQPGDVLFDDHPENIEIWQGSGGIGILVPRGLATPEVLAMAHQFRRQPPPAVNVDKKTSTP